MFQGMTVGEQRTLMGLAVVIALGLGVQRYQDQRLSQPFRVQEAASVAASAMPLPTPQLQPTPEPPLLTVVPAAATPVTALPGPTPSASARGADGRINLNAATLQDLDTLPGIGPVRAQAILDLRARSGRFRTVDDLLAVDGIGEKTVESIRPLVEVK